jgi:hypothetical protein
MGFDITSKFVYHKAVISVDVFCRFKISCQSLIFCTSKFVTHFVDLCTCTFFCRSKLYGAFRLDPNSSQFFLPPVFHCISSAEHADTWTLGSKIFLPINKD